MGFLRLVCNFNTIIPFFKVYYRVYFVFIEARTFPFHKPEHFRPIMRMTNKSVTSVFMPSGCIIEIPILGWLKPFIIHLLADKIRVTIEHFIVYLANVSGNRSRIGTTHLSIGVVCAGKFISNLQLLWLHNFSSNRSFTSYKLKQLFLPYYRNILLGVIVWA